MIYVECYPDKILVNNLGIPSKEIKHLYGKGNICNKLERSRNSKGVVDEDPLSTQPSYISKLELLSDEHEIKLLYDENTQNYLIILCPRLEEWLLKAIHIAKVDINLYNLPEDADELHKTINTKPGKFEELIKILRKKSERFKTLEKILNF